MYLKIVKLPLTENSDNRSLLGSFASNIIHYNTFFPY
jgi:hypothetical protein